MFKYFTILSTLLIILISCLFWSMLVNIDCNQAESNHGCKFIVPNCTKLPITFPVAVARKYQEFGFGCLIINNLGSMEAVNNHEQLGVWTLVPISFTIVLLCMDS